MPAAYTQLDHYSRAEIIAAMSISCHFGQHAAFTVLGVYDLSIFLEILELLEISWQLTGSPVNL